MITMKITFDEWWRDLDDFDASASIAVVVADLLPQTDCPAVDEGFCRAIHWDWGDRNESET